MNEEKTHKTLVERDLIEKEIFSGMGGITVSVFVLFVKCSPIFFHKQQQP